MADELHVFHLTSDHLTSVNHGLAFPLRSLLFPRSKNATAIACSTSVAPLDNPHFVSTCIDRDIVDELGELRVGHGTAHRFESCADCFAQDAHALFVVHQPLCRGPDIPRKTKRKAGPCGVGVDLDGATMSMSYSFCDIQAKPEVTERAGS